MIGGNPGQTPRRIACETCKAPQFEYCVDADGSPLSQSHPARRIAARGALELTPGRLDMLRRLHADPTAHIEPSMRAWFLKHRLIEPAGESRPTPGHRRGRPPKRRHPLTAAGRAAIEVVEQQAAETQEGAQP